MLAVYQLAAKHRLRDVTSGRALGPTEVLCQQCGDTNGPADRHFEASAGTSGTADTHGCLARHYRRIKRADTSLGVAVTSHRRTMDAFIFSLLHLYQVKFLPERSLMIERNWYCPSPRQPQRTHPAQ